MIKIAFAILATMFGKIGCHTTINSERIHISDSILSPQWGFGYDEYEQVLIGNKMSHIHVHIKGETYDVITY